MRYSSVAEVRMQRLQALARSLLGLLNSVYPVPRALIVNRSLARSSACDSRWPALLAVVRSSPGDLETPAKELFSDEIARLRRLEDKLAGHFQFVIPLLPLAMSAAGVGLAKRDWVLFGLSVVAIVLLASGFYMTTWASRAVPLVTVTTDDLTESGTDNLTLQQRLSAARLWGAEQNARRGIQLNNAIFACQRCLFSSIVILSVAAGELARRLIE
jgi:hypothetical protein